MKMRLDYSGGGATHSDKIEPLNPMFRASGPIVGAARRRRPAVYLEN